MNVLITGGCGFVGSQTVKQCVENGMNVSVIDNLSTGSINNIKPYLQDVQFFNQDICEPLGEIFHQSKPDAVIHLAAQASVPKSKKNFFYDARVNILGTLNVLSFASQYDVEKMVYSSTSAVYGEPEYLPVDPNHRTAPKSPYGISKLASELYLKNNLRLTGIPYTVLRYGNVYGPGQNIQGEGGVVAIFAHKLTRGMKPVIYGDGEQTRDFVYVEDVARANVMAVHHGNNCVVNVSTGISTSLNELWNLMTELENLQIKPVYKKAKDEDIKHSLLDSSSARTHLNWEPLTSFKKGLKNTLDFYRP